MFGNADCLALAQLLENLRKSSESVRKFSEDRAKTSSLVCLCNKQNNSLRGRRPKRKERGKTSA